MMIMGQQQSFAYGYMPGYNQMNTGMNPYNQSSNVVNNFYGQPSMPANNSQVINNYYNSAPMMQQPMQQQIFAQQPMMMQQPMQQQIFAQQPMMMQQPIQQQMFAQQPMMMQQPMQQQMFAQQPMMMQQPMQQQMFAQQPVQPQIPAQNNSENFLMSLVMLLLTTLLGGKLGSNAVPQEPQQTVIQDEIIVKK